MTEPLFLICGSEVGASSEGILLFYFRQLRGH